LFMNAHRPDFERRVTQVCERDLHLLDSV
jgi:hypothetical protein